MMPEKLLRVTMMPEKLLRVTMVPEKLLRVTIPYGTRQLQPACRLRTEDKKRWH